MNTTLTTPMTATPAMTRRDPFGMLFEDFFNDGWMRPGWLARLPDMPAITRARMDVVDKGAAFEITVDLPGVKKDDIHVSVEGGRVAIEAETKSEREVKDGDKLLHTERTAASYARNFELPAEITDAGAEAVYENGVLTLTLPKRSPTTGRRLTIS
jgi:HSP20 family protein